MDSSHNKLASVPILIAALLIVALLPGSGYTESPRDVVISEIAWMGTTTSSDDEWIEPYSNNTGSDIDLTNWTLSATDGTPSITLAGTIPAGGYYLLERTDDTTVPGVAADQTYSGGLHNDGEQLFLRDASSTLIDEVDCTGGWYAGHNDAKVPMVRVNTLLPGTTSTLTMAH